MLHTPEEAITFIIRVLTRSNNNVSVSRNEGPACEKYLNYYSFLMQSYESVDFRCVSTAKNAYWADTQKRPGPAVIKLFESENELKCKNRLHDFIETLCLFSKI